jgi:hypothetical protein
MSTRKDQIAEPRDMKGMCNDFKGMQLVGAYVITIPIENTLCDHKREPSKPREGICDHKRRRGHCICDHKRGGHGGRGYPYVCTMRLNIFSLKFPVCKK